MILKTIKSKKHPRAIFLKVFGTKDDFLCKIYPRFWDDKTTEIAEIIKKAFLDIDENTIGAREQNEHKEHKRA